MASVTVSTSWEWLSNCRLPLPQQEAVFRCDSVQPRACLLGVCAEEEDFSTGVVAPTTCCLYYLFFNYLYVLVFRRKEVVDVLVFRRKIADSSLGV